MNIPDAFLLETLEEYRRNLLSGIHAVMTGRITEYNPASGLASVQPALRRRTSSGAILTAPLLRGVPVFLPSADHAVSAGDPCLLLFCDFCLDGWLESGQPVIPPSPRQHDLSDAIALVGFFPALG